MINPLEPRDAFYGGHTEEFTLFQKDQDISYVDVTSLYPYINKTGKIPIGHHEIVTEGFTDIQQYEGLIKCNILPPRGLYIPVLPVKMNKLLFTLCRTCSDNHQQTPCQHNDEERSLTGTWVTDELKKALEKGYVVQRIYEVWHFDETEQYDPKTKTGGLFTDYVNTFLKMKQEASGWPEWCQNENDRWSYIRDYHEKEGILLDYNNIKKNPGLRALAKVMLNSFWGKFGQRSNMPRIKYISQPVEYFDMLTSDQIIVMGINFVSDEMVEMRYQCKEGFVEESGKTNVVIAAYTTAQARLKLYSYLEQLGPRALYANTDSVVYISRPGEWKPELGDYLGDLTDEVPYNIIIEFVTGGPKNYAYKIARPDKDGITTICKVRGITLNYKNSLTINFDTIKDRGRQRTTSRSQETTRDYLPYIKTKTT